MKKHRKHSGKGAGAGEAQWDDRLLFFPPEKLEWIQNNAYALPRGGYDYLGEFQHLRRRPLDLGELPLTDQQLLAVALLFYGGLKKKRAASAMKITTQSLDQHVKAALKKIRNSFAQ